MYYWTIEQLINDALIWTRYLAVNESVGRPEVKTLFFEAYQYAQELAYVARPEFFTKSTAIAGATVNLPTDFRVELALVVDDAGCKSGYVSMKRNDEWSNRLANTRLAPTLADPIGKKDAATITISPAITGGTMYYSKILAETDITDETKTLVEILPILFHGILLAKMRELILIRHFKISENPSIAERQQMLIRTVGLQGKRASRPLEVIEGVTEKPASIQLRSNVA